MEFKSITARGGVLGKIGEMIEVGKQTVRELQQLYDVHFDAIDNKVRTQLSGLCINLIYIFQSRYLGSFNIERPQ